ncbi:hypothetical protein L1887_32263 [Cichorium endivia]|nr:hypothetical protein L1887_32263 [Cichorium endivia]
MKTKGGSGRHEDWADWIQDKDLDEKPWKGTPLGKIVRAELFVRVDDVKAREKVPRYGALDGDIRRLKEFLRDYVLSLVGVAVSYAILVEFFMIKVSTREMVSCARNSTGKGVRTSLCSGRDCKPI